MAGDWIMMRTCLHEEPEVIAMADSTGLDEFAVVGRLHFLWSWADTHTTDGNAPSVTGVTAKRYIDRKVGCEGFAEAMVLVGWLVVNDDGITFPNFDRHNSSTAKTRALSRKRVQKHRQESRNAPSVTKALPKKRREQNKESVAPTRKKEAFKPPTVEEVSVYCAERHNKLDPERFHDYYEANGWLQSKGKPIRDWKAAVRTWERNGFSDTKQDAPAPGIDFQAAARERQARKVSQ